MSSVNRRLKVTLCAALCAPVIGHGPQSGGAAMTRQDGQREAAAHAECEYDVGRRLALCLIADCSVFVGQIRAAGEPVKADEKAEGARAVFHREVTVAVYADERDNTFIRSRYISH